MKIAICQTCSSYLPNLSELFAKPVRVICQTCPSYFPNISELFAKPLRVICQTCPSYLPNLSELFAKPVRVICQTFLSYLPNLSEFFGINFLLCTRYCTVLYKKHYVFSILLKGSVSRNLLTLFSNNIACEHDNRKWIR